MSMEVIKVSLQLFFLNQVFHNSFLGERYAIFWWLGIPFCTSWWG